MDSTYNPAKRGRSRLEQRDGLKERTDPATVCLVGLGYVGLPLAIEFDEAGHRVTGFDLDESKIEQLARGTDATDEVGDVTVAESDVHFTSDPGDIAESEFVIIAVPTPIDEHNHPNLDYVEGAGRTVGEHMTPGTTVVLESTVYPGATREVLVPALEAASGLAYGEEFFVGYSPERLTPGDPRHDLRNVVKVVSGQDEAVADDLASLYESIIDAGIHRAPSIEVAEASKVVENVQRDVNIALVNEFAMAFERMDVDVDWWAVLEAASTKWNFHDYRPGLVGGHCIPVDPYFFTYQSTRSGYVPELTLKGREVNESMPEHISELTIKALSESGKPLKECRVLILGLAYKPGVADTRMSKVDVVVERLQEYGIEVAGLDPYVEPDAIREEFGVEPVTEGEIDGFDGLILATPHPTLCDLEYDEVADRLNGDPILIDVAGALDGDRLADNPITYRRA